MGTAGDACTITGPSSYNCPTNYLGFNVGGGVYPRFMSPNSASVVSYAGYGVGIKYCGIGSSPCLDAAAMGYGLAISVDIEGSVFDHTHPFGNTPATGNATSTFRWLNNREVSDIAGFATVDNGNFFQHMATCVITGNYFDAQVEAAQNDVFGGCRFTYNVFAGGQLLGEAGAYPWGQFDWNVQTLASSQGPNNVALIPISNNIFNQTLSYQGSAHMGIYMDSNTDYVLTGNIGDRSGIATEAHCGDNLSRSGHKAVVLDNLAVMTAAGDPACEWIGTRQNAAGQTGSITYTDHNGVNGSGYDAWMGFTGHSSSYYQTNTAFGALRANIGWSPSSAGANLMISDFDGAGTEPTTMTDANTVIDWNNTYNGTASSKFPSSTLNGTPYQINSTTTPVGVHEKHASPKYIDTARRLDTWASRVMGQAQSVAGAKAALWSCQNMPACIGNLYAWVRRGWQPTNIALKGAAHDGGIIGFSGTYGSGYSGTCGVTITPRDAWDLGGAIPAMTATATCAFVGGVPRITLASGGAHYRIATPAAVAITCGGCTPSVAASLTPIIQPSDIGPVPMVVIPSAF
jgi:hypothetical protein